MQETRPAVPADVKRQLRQEAAFGCCRCGHPFIQYHHIIPWAEDQHFRPEDMMVLCGQCHPLCTVGAIPEADQRALKARPKNVADSLVRGQLFVNSSQLRVNLGGAQVTETPDLLMIAGRKALSVRLDDSDGRLLLSAVIQDRAGNQVGYLHDNEWTMAADAVWDFEAQPLHSTVRLAPRDIAFSVDVRDDEVNLQGKWFHEGNSVEFSPSEVRLGSMTLRVENVTMCDVFIAI